MGHLSFQKPHPDQYTRPGAKNCTEACMAPVIFAKNIFGNFAKRLDIPGVSVVF